MIQAAFVISLIIFSSVAHAQQHQLTWKLISDQNMSSFDMLNTRSGLLGIDDNGVRILAKYDNGTINGFLSTGGSITSIIIRDASTAYMLVRGEGIYKSTNRWKDFSIIASIPNGSLLAVYQSSILANFGAALNISTDGVTFTPVKGILSTDTVSAADFFNPMTAVAVTGKKLYLSSDSGKNWFLILDTLDRTNSIYMDRAHGAIYIGGAQCLKSFDSGKSWQTLSSIFFTLAGPVVGARDCSGNFYIAPDAKTHGTMYRSIDQGIFFQEAGPAIFSSVRLKKGVALDRGSTIFWLDSSGLLSVVRDGIDSVITDSVRDHILIQTDSGVTNSLCPNTTPSPFSVSVSFDQCTEIILDSLQQISPSPSFAAKFIPGSLTNTSTKQIPFTFHASHSGWDTARCSLKFHSPATENFEQKLFDVIGLGIPGNPELVFNSHELDFSSTELGSVKKISVLLSNPGCDVLIIDTIFSTNPAIFILALNSFPVKVTPGKSMEIIVSFSPHLSGRYLESLVVRTNVGNRNLTLRGTGILIENGVPEYILIKGISIYPNPASNIVTISSASPLDALPKNISLYDLMGKKILTFQTGGYSEPVYHVATDLHTVTNGLYFLDFGYGKFERIVIRH